MGDTEADLGGDAGAADVTDAVDAGADTGAGADSGDDSGSGVSDDFPKVEEAPEPDNPRYGAEHINPEEETPQPLPGGEGTPGAEG
jgi:hypothetical protein